MNITVEPGDSASDIAVELYDKKVVKGTKAFTKAAAAEPKSKNIGPGVYKLFLQMPAAAALAMLLDPDKNLLVNKVTVPEGMITLDIYAALAKASGLPVADFVAAGKDPVSLGVDPAWFTAARGVSRPVITSVEGFLFPATYKFSPGQTAKQMLAVMVEQFDQETADLHFIDQVRSALHITPYEALIAASIAQAEAQKAEDFAKVAKVLYNRAYSGKFPCACLGLDSEVNYWLRLQGKDVKASEHLTMAQLHDAADPYNTHDKPGPARRRHLQPGQRGAAGCHDPGRRGQRLLLHHDRQERHDGLREHGLTVPGAGQPGVQERHPAVLTNRGLTHRHGERPRRPPPSAG